MMIEGNVPVFDSSFDDSFNSHFLIGYSRTWGSLISTLTEDYSPVLTRFLYLEIAGVGSN